MDHALRLIGVDRCADPAGCQIAGGTTLPVLALLAHLADFDAAVTFVDRTERSTRLDRLQLLWIADQPYGA